MSGLEAQALAVRLGGRTVLDGVTLKLRPGEVVALAGANGAGKSTLLACLAGLRRPEGGAVRLDGLPLDALAPRARARRLAWLPQTPEVGWPMSVETLAGLGRLPRLGGRGPGTDDRAAVARALRAVDLEALAGRDARTLSGGERARALLARALAGEPDWLLADEPLAGLDPLHVLETGALLRRTAAGGVGVLATVHDLQAAARFADRLVVLAGGRVLAYGAPAAVLTPDLLARAYGVSARVGAGASGPVVEVLGPRPPSAAPEGQRAASSSGTP